jgi:hypothetical protein
MVAHMRMLLAGILTVASTVAWCGPIADQFAWGYDGVKWGLPLADLVGMMPKGDHYFSTAPGHRVYTVRSDAPLLGVPREGTRVQYHLGTDGGVESIAVGIPYDRREQLLGALMSQFGAYSIKRDVGAATYFRWPQDQQVRITVRVSRDPRYGIAEFWIDHIVNATPKPSAR